MEISEAKQLFRGPMISVVTPFTADFELDLDALKENIRFMIDHGLGTGHGVLLVAAAGGEFPMLTMEERKRVIAASVEAADGQIPIAASIQFLATQQVIELARHAHEVGAVLGQLSAPYYYPPPEEDIYQLFKAVSEETELPLMIYNNWWNTLNMNVEMVGRLAELENVVALKWSAPSSSQFTEGLRRYAGRLAVIDNEGLFVWSHMLGAVGFITHIGNFWPEYPLTLWELLETEAYDEVIAHLARFYWPWRKWAHSVAQETEGEGPFNKAAMALVGLQAGPPRPPGRPVRSERVEELEELFARAEVPTVGER
ncbi:MAG: dihydrodipicolinate synthase family protein [Chloroflexota bacterium]|nr:dihydrodipicolinate synthase family protein [Chloroflexota bacterium]